MYDLRVPLHTSIPIKHPISQQFNRFTYQSLKLDCNPFIIENVNQRSKVKNKKKTELFLNRSDIS